MRKLVAWLGVATLFALTSTVQAQNDVLKPYVVMILDTSGSMVCTSDICGTNPTGSGPPSCGGADNKLDHAKCAINNIVNSYGDMVFALGRFRTKMGGTTTSGTFPAGCCEAGPGILGTNGCPAGPSCDATTSATGAMLQLLTGLVDGNNAAAAKFTDFTGNSCTTGGSDPEIWDAEGACPGGFGADDTCGGATPLDGVLRGAKRYLQGLQATDGTTLWSSSQPGFDPIRTDPFKTVFLPPQGQTSCDPNPNTCNSSASCTTNCCCTEQCRPYVVILLTDGAESCSGNPADAADDLLDTVVDNRRYRIETRPIGFGLTPGSSAAEAIEDIAHAGGAFDVPNVNEGYYAQDEAGLELAISQILADSVRSESCNELDDDCDTLVDEDFPNKGGTCTNGQPGNCARTGTLECRLDGTGLECNAPTVTPGSEGTVCNQEDDDCDGFVDEHLTCTTCVPVGETCNNKDDDCDSNIDEGLTRACGMGTCTGTEVCTNGNWGGCTAPPVGTEVCNGLDDDCDGVCDGFDAECSDVVTPGGPGTDNPGHPSNNPIPENICRPGMKTCPSLCSATGNNFGACSGEVKPCNGVTPCTDPCNGLDDDCDNLIDEDFAPADCSTNCGVGTTTCANGNIQCNSTPATDDTTCDNNDDDCDGMIDEDWTCANPINGMCPCGEGMVCDGEEACVNGAVVCQGGPLAPETCNCDDEDCDGNVDEGTVCPGGATCTNCQCAFACSPGEFPCPLGKKCEDGFCVNDPCFEVDCPPMNGNAQTCVPDPSMPNEPLCVDICTTKTCPNGLICYAPTGECRPDDCTTFPDRCGAGEVCIVKDGLGTCVSNTCEGVTCPADQYCLDGNCVPSCADVTCADGERCRQGMCETDPCGGPCPFGQACNDDTGECIEDPCKVRNCQQGQWCNPNQGQCEDDPCVANEIVCPHEGEVCRGGTCIDEEDLRPDAAGAIHVTVGGGGGCSTTSGGGGFLLALALLLARRRRRVRGASSGGAR